MKISIGEKDYTIDQLTIEQYEIVIGNPNIKDDELISLLTGADIKEIRQCPYADIKFVANFLKSDALLYDDIGAPLEMAITINGNQYGLIEPAKMTYEEWINFEVFMAQSPINVGLLSTHLYRPIEELKSEGFCKLIPYDLDECQSRVNEFRRNMSVKTFASALFFLTSFGQQLIESFLSSMETKVKVEREKLKTKKTTQQIRQQSNS